MTMPDADDLWSELVGDAAPGTAAPAARTGRMGGRAGVSNATGRRQGGPPVNGPHRPTEATRQRVSILTYLRVAPEVIADELGIGKKMLRLRYAYELRRGAEVIAARIGMLAVEKALAGDRGMLGVLTRSAGIGKADEADKGSGSGKDGDGDGGPPLDLGALDDAGLAALLKAIDGGTAGGAAPDGAGRDREAAPAGAVDADPRKSAGKVPRKRS